MCLALPGKIVTILEEENLRLRCGNVDFAGICKEVRLDYIPGACVGDYVLVHVGFALSVVDQDEARRICEALRRLDELEEDSIPTCPESADSAKYNTGRVGDSSGYPVKERTL